VTPCAEHGVILAQVTPCAEHGVILAKARTHFDVDVLRMRPYAASSKLHSDLQIAFTWRWSVPQQPPTTDSRGSASRSER
jgi:hypothetical protein